MTGEIEEWRPVGDPEGRYEVSNLGRVRSWVDRWGVRNEPRIVSTRVADPNHYPMVNLMWDGKATTRSVHSLVCQAFIGPVPEGMQVRHLNGERHDARLDNLVYGTPKENMADKRVHGTQPLGSRHPHSKLSYLKAKAIRSLYAGGEFGYEDLAEVFGVGSGTIRKIINGSTWREEDSPQRISI